MDISQKLRTELLYTQTILLLVTYLKKTKTILRKDIGNFMFTALLFTIAKIWNQCRCPLIDVHTVKYYLDIKKNEILPFAINNMDEPRGYLPSEISQTEKSKYQMMSLICEI